MQCLDLPPTFMHANYNPTMTTISHTTQSLGRDLMIKKMTTIGYSSEVCQEAMEQTADDDLKALALLQWRLVHGDDPMPEIDDMLDAEERDTMRQEEAVALESIYGNKFIDKSDKEKQRQHFCIELTAHTMHRGKKYDLPVSLEVMIADDSAYPSTVPVFAVLYDQLPAYLKLSMVRGLVIEAEANLGLPLVYMCAEWLQEHMDDIIAHPPKLRDISQAITHINTIEPHNKKSKSNGRRYQQKTLSPAEQSKQSQQLMDDLANMHASDEYQQKIAPVRSKLPANGFKKEIMDAVHRHQIIIVSGETGCGKTTQVPQFILDNAIESGKGATCNIICTQPRKVAAIGVAGNVPYYSVHKYLSGHLTL